MRLFGVLDQCGIEHRFFRQRMAVEDQRQVLQRLAARRRIEATGGARQGAFDLSVMIDDHRQPAMAVADLLGPGAGFGPILFGGFRKNLCGSGRMDMDYSSICEDCTASAQRNRTRSLFTD